MNTSKFDIEACLKNSMLLKNTTNSKVVLDLRHAAYAGREENEGGDSG